MKRRNIFLLGSNEEYTIMKKWAAKNHKYHLNGWFHDKMIPTNPRDLVNEYESLIGNELVDHFVLDPYDMDPKILKASIDWAESQGSRIHMIQSGTDTLSKKLERKICLVLLLLLDSIRTFIRKIKSFYKKKY